MSDPRIFICYRHDGDHARTHRLYDRLKREFGADEVFMDEFTVRAVPRSASTSPSSYAGARSCSSSSGRDG